MASQKPEPYHSEAFHSASGGKTSPVKNEASFVLGLLSASKSVRALIGLKLTHLGLRAGQDAMLMALQTGNPLRVSQLASVLAIRASTVSKMLDILEASKLVVRSADKRDARRTLVQLTPIGVEMQSRIREVWLTFDVELRREAGPDFELEHLQQIEKLLRSKLERLR